MHAPQYILDEMQKLHPWIRLGWKGEKRTGPDDELNKGYFYILQLITKYHAKFEWNEPWEDKGPIYGKPFDRMARIPYMMAGPFHPGEVDDDAFVEMIRRLLKPQTERMVESCKSEGDKWDDEVSDLAGEMGSYLYWRSRQHDASSDRTVPASDLTEDDKATLRGENKRDLSDVFMPNM